MNNDINNLISVVSNKYNLTPVEIGELTERFKSDTRDFSLLEKDIDTAGSYYKYQHKLKDIINNTNNLETGKNYYVTAFDNNGNLYLHPVSISVLNADESFVMVDNSFKGYQKHTQVDDIEIAVSQIGNLLGFDVNEEYRLYDASKNKHSIVIRDLVNNSEFYDIENLNKRFLKLINNGKYKKEKWVDVVSNITVANSMDDYKLVIEHGLNLLKSLPSIIEEDYKKIEDKYFDMILFDCIIGQSERNFNDYGILCDKETKKYSFATLFDNVYPSILKNNDVIVFNGVTCNRYELIECLFLNFYDKIKNRIDDLISNKIKYLMNIDVILKYNLEYTNYVMMLNNIVGNFNYFEKLNSQKEIMAKNVNNAGFANVLQAGVGLIFILGFSVLIGYLLFVMQ